MSRSMIQCVILKMIVEVYTDGSGTKATLPGGYGWVILEDGVKKYEGSGHLLLGTNNDCELQGAISGLDFAASKYTKEQATVYLVSDSQIILGWANGRFEFKQEDKYATYEQLKALVLKLGVRTKWVRGHDGNEHNERCDKLANAARLKKEII